MDEADKIAPGARRQLPLERHDRPDLADRQVANADEVRFIKGGPEMERMVDVLGGREKAEDFDFGKFIRGMACGEWSGSDREKRAWQSYKSSEGAVLIPEELSASIYDFARSASVAFKCGAVTVPMKSAKMLIGKITADPTATWHPEASDATADSSLAFGALELQARTMMIYCEVSRELWSDAAMMDKAVRMAIGGAMAVALDAAVLVGSGAGQNPEGIFYNSDVTQTAIGGAGTTPYEDLSDLIYRVEDANHVATSVIVSPRSRNYLRKLMDGEGHPLPVPEWLPPVHVTTSIADTYGAGSDESIAICGDCSRVIVGLRNQLEIGVTTEGSSLMKSNKVAIAGVLRADVGIVQPESLQVLTGILSNWTA